MTRPTARLVRFLTLPPSPLPQGEGEKWRRAARTVRLHPHAGDALRLLSLLVWSAESAEDRKDCRIHPMQKSPLIFRDRGDASRRLRLCATRRPLRQHGTPALLHGRGRRREDFQKAR